MQLQEINVIAQAEARELLQDIVELHEAIQDTMEAHALVATPIIAPVPQLEDLERTAVQEEVQEAISRLHDLHLEAVATIDREQAPDVAADTVPRLQEVQEVVDTALRLQEVHAVLEVSEVLEVHEVLAALEALEVDVPLAVDALLVVEVVAEETKIQNQLTN